MIVGFIGDIGSGKTMSMTYWLLKSYVRGSHIFTNYKLKFPKGNKYGNIEYLDSEFFKNYAKSKLNLMNSCVAIDEAHVFIDSRRAMSQKNKVFSKFITQSRKRSVNLYYTTQDLSVDNFYRSGQVDLRLRKLTDYLVFCKFVGFKDDCFALNYIYSQGEKKGLEIIALSKVKNKYDTNEIIDIDD